MQSESVIHFFVVIGKVNLQTDILTDWIKEMLGHLKSCFPEEFPQVLQKGPSHRGPSEKFFAQIYE